MISSQAKGPVRVLILDDDEDDYVVIRDLLAESRDESFKLDWVSTYGEAMQALQTGSYDVCLLDYRLGEFTGLDFLKELKSKDEYTPVIVLTGFGEHEIDLEVMRHGAADYLVKSEVTAPLLERSIRYALHRARTHEALREREAQILLQDRLASVGLLASSLAHEIGTPLGVIRGRAEILSMQVKDDPAVQKNATVIISQIDRVSKLIRSLLNLARGERDQYSEAVSFNEIAHEVIELMGHEFRKHQIDVRNELPEDINIVVVAKAAPLHQVLLNLMVNSMHAIESAKKSGQEGGHFIRLCAKGVTGNWEISVQDSGSGISVANLKNLFKPFFTTKDIGVGTGLGLATSYRILESWGGSIRVESEAGKGATFTLVLPARAAAPTA